MITAFIKGQSIETSESVIVAESINYLKGQFVFISSEWNGLEKTAYFKQGAVSHSIKLDENNIAYPIHLSAGKWSISLVGRKYENGEIVQRITTDTADIEVKPFVSGSGTAFPEPTPTEIERIDGNIGNLPDLLTKDKTSIVSAINEVYKRGGSGGGGEDGFSPIVEVEKIEGGHRVSITTASGTQSFDVFDGYTPVKGVDYFDGYTPQKGIDYFDGNDYILTEADKTEIANAVLDSLTVAEGGLY